MSLLRQKEAPDFEVKLGASIKTHCGKLLELLRSVKSCFQSLSSFLNIYLFVCLAALVFAVAHRLFLVVACKLLVGACGIWFPDQGWNLGPLLWEHSLATGPPGKSLPSEP